MQPSEQQQHPIDYLDTISTVPKNARKGKKDLLFFGALMGGVLIALLIGGLAFFNAGPNATDDLATLSAKLTNMQSVSDASQKKLVSSKLRATNTNLSLALTNANRDIGDLLTANGLSAGKLDPKITSKENTDELNERLEDARLNAIFDRTYAREISYELTTTIILIEQLDAKIRSSSQKEFLAKTYKDLVPLQDQFSKFSSAD